MPDPNTLQSVLGAIQHVQTKSAAEYDTLYKEVSEQNAALNAEIDREWEPRLEQWRNRGWFYRRFHQPPTRPRPNLHEMFPTTRTDHTLADLADQLDVARTLGASQITLDWYLAKRLAQIIDVLNDVKETP